MTHNGADKMTDTTYHRSQTRNADRNEVETVLRTKTVSGICAEFDAEIEKMDRLFEQAFALLNDWKV